MGDFDIDVGEVFKDDLIKKYAAMVDEQMAYEKQYKPVQPRNNVIELGNFRVVKCNNGYVVNIGANEGYLPTDLYVCKEANEIGDLITAHIVSTSLEN